jgi:hypothetical protein
MVLKHSRTYLKYLGFSEIYETWSTILFLYQVSFKIISRVYCYGKFWSFFRSPNLIDL